MIFVASLLTSIRAKLGDNDSKSYRYSDQEIIDAINDALSMLSEETLCFSRTWAITAKACVTNYLLPEDFLKPLSLKINGKLIEEVVSMESRADSDHFYSGISYDLQSIHIFSALKEGDKIELYYKSTERVNDVSEKINLPSMAKEVIVFYALHQLFMNPIKKDGLTRSGFYLAQYERKLPALRSRVKMNSKTKNIRVKYTKV